MQTRVFRFIYYWLPLILYCLLIFIQSSQPSPEQLPDIDYFDKLLHFLAYGFLGVLFYRAYAASAMKAESLWLILLSILSASLYGISDEIHQYYVPFREADIFDVLADILGAACSVALYHLWARPKPASG